MAAVDSVSVLRNLSVCLSVASSVLSFHLEWGEGVGVVINREGLGKVACPPLLSCLLMLG